MKIKGSTLKWIAMATMLIDHLAAVLFMPALGIMTYCTLAESWEIGGATFWLMLMRRIGRLAFPIFSFLLVEGLMHTRSRKKYLRNLLILAVVSEVPFDLAVTGHIVDFGYQNVAFTLALGFFTCWGIDWLDETQPPRGLVIKKAALVALMMFTALICMTDYHAYGVGAIVLMYLLRDSRLKQCLFGAILFAVLEPAAMWAFILIYLYNGERGRQPKWLFYAFYPTHLLVLYFTRLWWIGW